MKRRYRRKNPGPELVWWLLGGAVLVGGAVAVVVTQKKASTPTPTPSPAAPSAQSAIAAGNQQIQQGVDSTGNLGF